MCSIAQTEVVEGERRRFDLVDFREGEDVAGGFVPVGLAVVERVEGEADGFDLALPIGARG